MTLNYGYSSRRAVARLMRPYNDIDIYVEDGSYVGVYEKIVNRVLGKRAKIQKVIALGPKELVIRAAANDNDGSDRRRLYIVDGDIELISKFNSRKITNLYRLRVYALENLVIESEALEKYCSHSCPGVSLADAVSKIDVSGLVHEVNTKLGLYFVLIAISKRLNIRESVFSINPNSVTRLENGHPVGIDTKKLRGRISEMISKIVEISGRNAYRRAKREIIFNLKRRKITPLDYVSAKHFFIHYLNGRSCARSGIGMKQQLIVSYLADHCTLRRDAGLARRLKELTR